MTLADELWTHVFQFLDISALCANVHRVCKRFKALSFLDRRTFQLLKWNKRVTQSKLISTLQEIGRFQNSTTLLAHKIEHLQFEHCTLKVQFHTLLPFAPNVKKLQISSSLFSNSQLKNLAALSTLSHQLVSLDLSACSKISIDSLAHACRAFTQLKELNIRGLHLLNALDFPTIALAAPQLTSLDVKGHKDIPGLALKQFSQLRSLCLQAAGVTLKHEDILDCAINSWQQLQCLDLKFTPCRELCDATIVAISTYCTQLIGVELQGLTQLTHVAFNSLNNLQFLNLIGCVQLDNEALLCIGQRNPELSRIELKQCAMLSNDGVIQFSELCPKLKILNLTATSVTEIVIEPVLNNLPLLQVLNVSECDLFVDKQKSRTYFM